MIASLATECRRSCSRTSGIPASSRARFQLRHKLHSRLPREEQMTKPRRGLPFSAPILPSTAITSSETTMSRLPVLVSGKRSVPCRQSTISQRRSRTSSRRMPVRASRRTAQIASRPMWPGLPDGMRSAAASTRSSAWRSSGLRKRSTARSLNLSTNTTGLRHVVTSHLRGLRVHHAQHTAHVVRGAWHLLEAVVELLNVGRADLLEPPITERGEDVEPQRAAVLLRRTWL
jgi:hypothetical protein